MEDAGDVAERAGLDRVDQRPHPLAPGGGEVDRVGRAVAALGDMLGRPALARIDDPAGEQRLARRGEAPRLGQRRRTRSISAVVEMRLRPVEIDAGDFEAQPAQPVGLGREQLVERA